MDRTTSGRVTKPPAVHISKRPLLRPAIPSPYSGSAQQKVIYVGTATPFLSAVKRVEKLLRLSDQRLVQAATELAKQRTGPTDEIRAIAEAVAATKKNRRHPGEEMVVKGTGKAIPKVMALGGWFQQREEYRVRWRTGTVGAVDDVSFVDGEGGRERAGDGGEAGDGVEDGGEGGAKTRKKRAKEAVTRVVKREETGVDADGKTEVTETRIRQLSVLEAYVSLR